MCKQVDDFSLVKIEVTSFQQWSGYHFSYNMAMIKEQSSADCSSLYGYLSIERSCHVEATPVTKPLSIKTFI
jgi:hypothetical protein